MKALRLGGWAVKIGTMLVVLFVLGCAGSLLNPPASTVTEDGEIIAPLDYHDVLKDAATAGADAALEIVAATPAGKAGVDFGSALYRLLITLGVLGPSAAVVQTVRRNRSVAVADSATRDATTLAAGVRAIETAVYAGDTAAVKANIRHRGTAGVVDKARALANNHYGE